jgi:hypothetical protein
LRRLGFKGKLTTKSLDTVAKRRAKISLLKKKGAKATKWEGVRRTKGSSFAEAGVTLRRLGYKGKLSGKRLDSISKRKAKIKALKAKGGSAKKWEGVRRAKRKRNPASMSDEMMIDYLLENPAELEDIFYEDQEDFDY